MAQGSSRLAVEVWMAGTIVVPSRKTSQREARGGVGGGHSRHLHNPNSAPLNWSGKFHRKKTLEFSFERLSVFRKDTTVIRIEIEKLDLTKLLQDPNQPMPSEAID